MGTEQLYFIIGFLLGVLLVGTITLAALLVYYEWLKPKNKENDEWLFVFAGTSGNQILKHKKNWFNESCNRITIAGNVKNFANI